MALTERAFTIPEIMLVAGTRVALGVGVGLLLSDRLSEDQRGGHSAEVSAARTLSGDHSGDKKVEEVI